MKSVLGIVCIAALAFLLWHLQTVINPVPPPPHVVTAAERAQMEAKQIQEVHDEHVRGKKMKELTVAHEKEFFKRSKYHTRDESGRVVGSSDDLTDDWFLHGKDGHEGIVAERRLHSDSGSPAP